MDFHPHSIELRYSLSLVAQRVSLAQPRSIHVAAQSADLAVAAVRQLGQVACPLRVDSLQVQQAARSAFGLATLLEADCGAPADFGLYAFAPLALARGAREAVIALACENALSYKSLLYPHAVRGTVFQYLAALKPRYTLQPVASLFTPQCIALWLMARLAERLDSTLYFRLEDYAMRRLVGYGPMWRFSYLVVLVGAIRP